MKKTLIALAAALLMVSPVWASPDSSLWRQVEMLGVDGQHYFIRVKERVNPGTYYDYTIREVIEKYHISTNRRIGRIVVRETVYHRPVLAGGEWTHKDKPHPAVNVSEYLTKNKVRPLSPVSVRPKLGAAFIKRDLYLTRGKHKAFLRKTGVSRLVDDYEPGDTRLTAIYIAKDYVLIIVQQGTDVIDADYIQKVLPVSLRLYHKARDSLYIKK